MKKRILSLFLVLVMALSLLPAQVFAASYTFDPNATIFTQNYTTETPRPNNLGDYFTVTSTPLSTADKTTTWNTGNNGTSVAVFNKDGSKLYGDTHAILTFTFKKNCNFWFKHLFSIGNRSPYSYAELRLNGTAIAKGTSSDKLASPYNVDVKAGDIFEIDFYSEEDFMTPCAMTLKNIRCTDLAAQDVTVSFDGNQANTKGTVSGTMAACRYGDGAERKRLHQRIQQEILRQGVRRRRKIPRLEHCGGRHRRQLCRRRGYHCLGGHHALCAVGRT